VGADIASDNTKRPFHTILIDFNLFSHVKKKKKEKKRKKIICGNYCTNIYKRLIFIIYQLKHLYRKGSGLASLICMAKRGSELNPRTTVL